MALEMHHRGKAKKESDVYRFGVLMLEVVCGRKPVHLQVEDPDEGFMLLQAVWGADEGGSILSAVEPELLDVYLASKCSTAAGDRNGLPCNPLCGFNPVNELCSELIPVVNVGDVEGKSVPLLHLGLQCCLSDPESRPSMRVVEQVIMQLQGSPGEDPMSVWEWMPPLPSTMPVYGSFLQVPKWCIGVMDAPLDDVEASFMQRRDTLSVLRRRCHSG